MSIALNGRLREIEQTIKRLADKVQILEGAKKIAAIGSTDEKPIDAPKRGRPSKAKLLNPGEVVDNG